MIRFDYVFFAELSVLFLEFLLFGDRRAMGWPWLALECLALRFASCCVMASILAILTSIRCDTKSELEELNQIQSLFRQSRAKPAQLPTPSPSPKGKSAGSESIVID